MEREDVVRRCVGGGQSCPRPVRSDGARRAAFLAHELGDGPATVARCGLLLAHVEAHLRPTA